MKLTGKACVITGAGSGIGRAMAVAFGREGARVVAADLNQEAAQTTHQILQESQVESASYVVDVCDARQVAGLVDFTVRRFGQLDVLCNNAGIGIAGKVHDTSEEDWERIFAVNVRGTFLGCKYAVPAMLSQGGGIIVNTASIGGLVGLRDRAAYCASKAAVVGLTKAMAVDYARDNIRINCLCPGTTETPWVARINAHLGDYEVIREQMNARQLIGRMGTPEEIAAVAVFLASNDASFIHGSALIVDGGLTAQ